ncbi:Deoxyribodipyrimidine photo-lyase-related protein [Vibrio aerogenes CECT 7868]|uniref:Deoxyribodipyrimidine photo-lyase-related protein n=1 Tax=Vibrio aerogenes CECT 7868 TaxID=1216006 RepID=A0A1M5VFG3_9VIBR|nr:cryptochrome/photolyase family protein [Vibrio aerogenes]SHH73976.1 Deoxyribodipyrimidine photo-lyase-related protein [Vibrio aerogenes CECT 7868]
MGKLRVILGDQLNEQISSLQGTDKTQDVILMCEVQEEATYVRHHQKKIAFIFSAMRHFAQSLKAQGYEVWYTRLNDPQNSGSFTGEVVRCLQQHACDAVILTQPGEYRVAEMVRSWPEQLNLPVDVREDNRFLCPVEDFRQWAKGRQQLRMEYFYRDMRRRYRILLEDDEKPVGGKWNYDTENRKPVTTSLDIPPHFSSAPDEITRQVIALVSARFSDHFGDIEPFYFAVTRQQALVALTSFIDNRLRYFGDYQDAMLEGEPWMFHSHLSFYLNCGLLLPLECVRAAEAAWREGKAPLNAVEGFIRQLIGWREFVRGIYWLNMPDYASRNYFGVKGKLPAFYWSGETEMNCLRQCVLETRKHAYAHHIQRLMVLGNFALLTGVNPDALNQWFLSVYADAYEWVELPNVTGMVLFADGGYLASKPYAAGGSYIHKMSDYCRKCRYKVTQKNGADACPFNYLYWDFLIRNREKLSLNPRVAMMYKTYDRMNEEKHRAIRQDSQTFLTQLSEEEPQ